MIIDQATAGPPLEAVRKANSNFLLDPAPPSQFLPILVGISGKRKFLPGDANDPRIANQNAAYMQIFRRRFADFAIWLDHREQLPTTPKVLLCGGAEGVDIEAAEAVLHRPLWSVVIVLPFEEELFMAEFSPEDRTRFEALKRHAKVRLITLPPLCEERFEDRNLEAPSKCLPVSDISPKTEARRQRYEQLALWLARASTIFIGATLVHMPGDAKPIRGDIEMQHGEHAGAKPGGTARAIAFRRCGIGDRYANDVIERSSELQIPSPIEEPGGGFVLLIDPDDEVIQRSSGFPPLKPLPPLQSVVNLRTPGASLLEAAQAIYRGPATERLDFESEDVLWEKALSTCKTFEALNLTARDSPAGGSIFTDIPPAIYLEDIRGPNYPIGRQQEKYGDYFRGGLNWMLVLSVLGSFFYSTYSEWHRGEQVFLGLYIFLIVVIVAIAVLENAGSWGIQAQDLRGLKEVMRVQIAWWRADIDRMVDRIHLCGIGSDLRMVRERATAICLWAKLQWRGYQPGRLWPDASDYDPCYRKKWHHGFGGVGKTWLDDQINYLNSRSIQQLGYLRRAERLANSALVATVLTLSSVFFVGRFPDGGRLPMVASALLLSIPFVLIPLQELITDIRCWRNGRVRNDIGLDEAPSLNNSLSNFGVGMAALVSRA